MNTLTKIAAITFLIMGLVLMSLGWFMNVAIWINIALLVTGGIFIYRSVEFDKN